MVASDRSPRGARIAKARTAWRWLAAATIAIGASMPSGTVAAGDGDDGANKIAFYMLWTVPVPFLVPQGERDDPGPWETGRDSDIPSLHVFRRTRDR